MRAAPKPKSGTPPVLPPMCTGTARGRYYFRIIFACGVSLARVFTALTLLSAGACRTSAEGALWQVDHHLVARASECTRVRPSQLSRRRHQKIYISTKGQRFGRFATTHRGNEAGRGGVGTSGAAPGGGPRQVEFSGRTITTTGASKGGMARRTSIVFSENHHVRGTRHRRETDGV
jgi:hypothetical protein